MEASSKILFGFLMFRESWASMISLRISATPVRRIPKFRDRGLNSIPFMEKSIR